jgi:nucleoside 2-deoxyribosyltransferase
MPKIFLSHAYRDADLADAIRRELVRRGVTVFDPAVEIRGGTKWRAAVKSGIEAADAVIVVVGSPDAVAASWVTYEAGAAEARGKPVIVVVSHDVPLADLPVELEGYRIEPLDPERPELAAGAILLSLRATA